MNHNNNNNKTKKKNDDHHQQFEFCEVCRLNHNQGRRHVYFPNHKTSLQSILVRFQSKTSDVKLLLKNPIPLLLEHANTNRLWCIFCNRDIVEIDSQFSCENSIKHLASGEHWKGAKRFIGRHGGGMDRVESFCISEADFEKWEKKCKSLKTEAAKVESVAPPIGALNNIHNEQKADYIINFHEKNVNSLNFSITNGVVPLQSYTNERAEMSSSKLSSVSVAGTSSHYIPGREQVGDAQCFKNSAGYMDDRHYLNDVNGKCPAYGFISNGSQVYTEAKTTKGESRSQGLLNLTQIAATPPEVTGGNVHTGAPPPWFDATQGNQLNVKQEPKRKSSKLNPKRVGAAWAERRKLELELEKRGEISTEKFDSNWLPNFGRVWQSGTRKVSRKEFQMENKVTHKGDDSQSESVTPLQPYVSKRMRRDTSG